MLDRYHLGQHPAVTLPHGLTWSEDPLRDRQWRQKLQQLRFVMALMYRWQDTGETGYRDRAIAARPLLDRRQSAAPPGIAVGLEGPGHGLAGDDARVHGRDAATDTAGWMPPSGSTARCSPTPSFYVVTGNHALNQSLGLLDVGCYLGRTDWQQLASRRLDRFVTDGHRRPGRLGRAGRQVRPLRLRPVRARTGPPATLRTAGAGRVRPGRAHPGIPGPGDPTRWSLRDHRRLRRPTVGGPSPGRPPSTPRAWARGHRAVGDGRALPARVCVRAHRLGRRQASVHGRDVLLAPVRAGPAASRPRRLRGR